MDSPPPRIPPVLRMRRFNLPKTIARSRRGQCSPSIANAVKCRAHLKIGRLTPYLKNGLGLPRPLTLRPPFSQSTFALDIRFSTCVCAYKPVDVVFRSVGDARQPSHCDLQCASSVSPVHVYSGKGGGYNIHFISTLPALNRIETGLGVRRLIVHA